MPKEYEIGETQEEEFTFYIEDVRKYILAKLRTFCSNRL